MPDDKTTKIPETGISDTGPDEPRTQAPAKEPVKAEPVTPEKKAPEQNADKITPPKDKAAPATEKTGTEKAPNVSVYNFSEIMAEKKAAEKGKAPEKANPSTDKGKTASKPDKAVKKEIGKTAEPPKRRGRPPKEAQVEAPADKKKATLAKETAPKQTSIWKEAKDKANTGTEKAPKAPAPGKTADKGAAAVKPPVTEQPKPPEPPKDAPRRGEEQIVYIMIALNIVIFVIVYGRIKDFAISDTLMIF